MLPLFNPYVVIALGLSLLGTSYLGFKAGKEHVKAQWDATVLATKESQERALREAAKAIAQIEVKSETIIQPIRTEIRTNTVYRECKHTEFILRDLNSLITGSEPLGSGILPETKPTN